MGRRLFGRVARAGVRAKTRGSKVSTSIAVLAVVAVVAWIPTSPVLAAPDAQVLSVSDDMTYETVAMYDGHSCAIVGTGALYCWGNNDFGQLGNGTWTSSAVPQLVKGLNEVAVDVAVGYRSTCALMISGSVKCWGDNYYGQLGTNGTSSSRSNAPLQVVGLTAGVTSIAVAQDTACAVLTSGAARCWGQSWQGSLGDGDLTTHVRKVPTQVVGLRTGVAAVSIGRSSTCALLKVGSVKCWGSNNRYQLGDGTTTSRAIPILVSGLSGVQQISVGDMFACALTVAGAVKCWGSNYYQTLGTGDTTDRKNPTATSLTSNVATIAAGARHVCVTDDWGQVACWGSNANGQFGDGTTTSQGSPFYVSNWPANVTAIASGYNGTCAIPVDSKPLCVGGNDSGQLGTGTTSSDPAAGPVLTADLPLSSSGTLTISGNPKVGGNVCRDSASTVTWTPGTVTTSLQWMRAGEAISTASGNCYSPDPSDLGKTLTLVATGSRTGFRPSPVTSNTLTISAGTFSASPTPAVVGNATSGKVLSANTGTWTPAASFTYRWLANGVAISGATNPTYSVLGTDVGKKISVEVTASTPGYTSVTKTSAQTAPVVAGPIPLVGAPAVAGTLQVGQMVTANEGTWTSGTTFTYQWSRASAPNGVWAPISNATAKTYTLTAADAGSYVKVQVNGSNTGYTGVSASSATSGAGPVVKAQFTSLGFPQIQGNNGVGQTLTAQPGTWTPTQDSFTYQWKKSTSPSGPFMPISNATAKTYVLQAGDKGSFVVVDVTAVKAGFDSATKTSGAVGTIN